MKKKLFGVIFLIGLIITTCDGNGGNDDTQDLSIFTGTWERNDNCKLVFSENNFYFYNWSAYSNEYYVTLEGTFSVSGSTIYFNTIPSNITSECNFVITETNLTITNPYDHPIAGVYIKGSGLNIPIVNDFNISGTGTFDFDGEQKSATITPKEGKTTGEITIYYTGIENTEYDKCDIAPWEFGKYSVTFDVASSEGWQDVANLSAGTITIEDSTPSVPTNLNASIVSSSSIRVNWNIASKAESYNVYYISETDESLELAGNTTAAWFLHTGLTVDTVYWYYVTAVNDYGESEYSDYKAIVICEPDAPSIVEATAVSRSQIDLRWSSVSNATGYKLYYNTTGSEGLKTQVPDNITYTSTSCSLEDLNRDTTYYFFVKAINSVGESDYSPAGSAKTFDDGAINAGLKVTLLMETGITLNWNTFTVGGATYNVRYDIYYTTGSPTNTKQLLEMGLVLPMYTLIGTPNTTYYFWVEVYNMVTMQGSGLSEMVMVRTGSPPPPLPPTPPTIIIPSFPPTGGCAGERTCTRVHCGGGRCFYSSNVGWSVTCNNGLVDCVGCKGSGMVSGKICSACKGAGKKICTFCNGSGMCPTCHGTGYL